MHAFVVLTSERNIVLDVTRDISHSAENKIPEGKVFLLCGIKICEAGHGHDLFDCMIYKYSNPSSQMS